MPETRMRGDSVDKRAERILGFWFDELGPQAWFEGSPELDAEIKRKFEPTWAFAARGDLDQWICEPLTTLALVVLLDQFPRNMFRGDRKAFSTDRKALNFAKQAVDMRHDTRIDLPGRMFFYMPFMHSEFGSEQERGVRLFMAAEADDQVMHARAHRWVIRKFGRFPYRNAALGRTNTAAEETFLADGGYKVALAAVSEA
jgi:uncharacterized protein (DUF924 family)